MISLILAIAIGQMAAPTVPVEDARPVVSKFQAKEAEQGVAVDDKFIYVIGDSVIGKYDRKTNEKVGEYLGDPNGAIKHMNGGVVLGNRLYCSHSNFPETPMVSSIEIFDTKTLKHVGSQSFGLDAGSLVWVDWRGGYWWVCFGHYNGKGGEPGMTNDHTVLVKYDKEWRRLAGYAFPKEAIARWDGMTCSGGVWGKDGLLYCTGHHMPEIYVFKLPEAGAVLDMVKIVKSPVAGQGLAIDNKAGQLFQMQRKERSIYVFDWKL